MIHTFRTTTVDIPIEGHNRIGIRLSGGADSAILLALVCETIVKLKVHETAAILPMTIHWDEKPFNKLYSGGVLDLVKSRYPMVNILEQKTAVCNSFEEYSLSQRQLEKELSAAGEITISMSGVTENPLEHDVDWGGTWHMRDTRRDPSEEPSMIIHADKLVKVYPFLHINKRGVADMYDYLNLREDLYPLTWSCEGYSNMNMYFQEQCGKCWWCKERQWGFGEL